MVGLTDRLDMTIAVDWDVKSKTKQKNQNHATCLRFLVNSYLSQLVPIFGQLVPYLWSTRTYPKSTRTGRVNKRGRVEHDRRGVGKSRS